MLQGVIISLIILLLKLKKIIVPFKKYLCLLMYYVCFFHSECSIESEKKVNILAIVLGTIAGIVLIGLLLLIIWKLIVTGHVSRFLIGLFYLELLSDWFIRF